MPRFAASVTIRRLASGTDLRVERVGAENVFLQYDFYHMQRMEGYLAETVRTNIDIISHFQIGGVPGRHEPNGRRRINHPYLFDVIDELGFEGWIGCEYRPAGDTVESLSWARTGGIAALQPPK